MATLFLRLDAGYVFDYFSILDVKKEHGLNVSGHLNETFHLLAGQLGFERLGKILKSAEYKELFKANDEVFNAVDLARRNKIEANEVDKLNTKRFEAKKNLQLKFFGDDELFEVKNI
jgi:hypothetical protein